MIGNLYMITLDIEGKSADNHHTGPSDSRRCGEKHKSSIDNVYDILVHVEPAGECQTDEKFGIDKGMVN